MFELKAGMDVSKIQFRKKDYGTIVAVGESISDTLPFIVYFKNSQGYRDSVSLRANGTYLNNFMQCDYDVIEVCND